MLGIRLSYQGVNPIQEIHVLSLVGFNLDLPRPKYESFLSRMEGNRLLEIRPSCPILFDDVHLRLRTGRNAMAFVP